MLRNLVKTAYLFLFAVGLTSILSACQSRPSPSAPTPSAAAAILSPPPTPSVTATAPSPPPTSTSSPTSTPAPQSTVTSTPIPQRVPITVQNADQLAVINFLCEHTSSVVDAIWSPDGTMIATSSWDETIQVWDGHSGHHLQSITHPRGLGRPAWSPDNTMLATSDEDGELILIWEVETWQVARTFELTLGGEITDIEWSPDGRWLAASTGRGKSVVLWQSETGEVFNALRVPTWHWLYKISWSPDGTRISAGGQGSSTYISPVFVWDAFSGELQDTIEWPMSDTSYGTWSPDWSALAFGMEDGTVALLSPAGELIRSFESSPADVRDVAWSPDGTLLAGLAGYSGGYGLVSIWEVQSGYLITTLTNPQPTRGVGLFGSEVRWSPDGTMLASVGGTRECVTIWAVVP